MHGLQTLQKLNDARVALAQSRSKTPVSDVVDGFFVFEPHGYEVVYHVDNKLPQDERAFLSIEFKGDDTSGPRFDVTLGGDAATQMKYTTAVNQTLDTVVKIATSVGLDKDEVAGRLGKMFVNINRN